jgi:hypothetical protein
MFENRYLRASVFAIALLLIIIPFGETLVSVWPWRLSEANWRFGAMGFFSKAFMTPMVGLVLLLAVAVAAESGVVLRVISVATALYALVGVAFAGIFVLDILQLRAGVRPDLRTAFDQASILAFLRTLASTAIAVLVALGAWRSGRRFTQRTRGGASGLIQHPKAEDVK